MNSSPLRFSVGACFGAAVLALAACGQDNRDTVAPASSSAKVAAQAACGKVTVANMNWQSAEVLASIDQIIMTHGYGCEVEIVPGDTMPTLTSMMEKGQPDVAPEAWINAVREPLEAAVKEGKLHYAAHSLSDGGVEGWWIPKYLADAHPEIKTIDDALARPDLFPAPEQKDKGAVHNCPSGWNCQITTENAFKAWDAASKNFVLLDTGSAAGLDGSIAKAYERKESWLGYYWAPTSILGKYDMVRLDAGVPLDREAFDSCNAKACDNPTKTDWPRAEVITVVTDRFKNAGGPAYEYLTRRSWDNNTVNKLLAWMSDNQATGEDGARYFLRNSEAVWTPWVTPEAADKIKAAL